MRYSLVGNDDGTSNITVVLPGQPLLTTRSDHPNWNEILDAAVNNREDTDWVALFDVGESVRIAFLQLTERVTVVNGEICLDGDPVDNALTRTALRFLEEDKNVQPLILFYEKCVQNPNKHSEEQLYSWLDNRDFTINEEGDIVAYKGVTSEYRSVHSGTASVNGVTEHGKIRNQIGDVVEMPRSQVVHDPSTGCSTGLHVATHNFAGHWSEICLAVTINPRDVVSVPTDTSAEKMRVCRYKVRSEVENPFSSVLVDDAEYSDITHEDVSDDEPADIDW